MLKEREFQLHGCVSTSEKAEVASALKVFSSAAEQALPSLSGPQSDSTAQ